MNFINLPSGVMYCDNKMGLGMEASLGNSIEFYYKVALTLDAIANNGICLEERYVGSPMQVSLGSGHILVGLEEGILGMKKAGSRIIYVPSHLAFGANGIGDKVGPHTNLYYEIFLLKILN